MIDLPGPLAVVCHDAGAANLILAWLAAEPRADLRPVMQGPAKRLWKARFERAPLMDIESALTGAAALLSGTGWQSDLEHRARALARAAGIRSAAVLDHWTNYPERFVREGETILPDELWVVDEDAQALAAKHFPAAVIRVKPNAYLAEQAGRIAPPPEEQRLLYVAEPARTDWGRGKPGEFQVLDYLLKNFDALGLPPLTPIRLWPHPSDPPGKYREWIEGQSGFDIALEGSNDLAEAIGLASIVAGAQTFAMVVALAAGRKVVCALPPWAPRCALPNSGIIHLSSLAESTRTNGHPEPAKGL